MTTFPRRLSVIVSADVVGYNRLMGTDGDGTTATLKKHRDAINSIFIEDGGRLVKTTGDGLLTEFPSAFHAVRASLGAQRMMAERNKDIPPDKRLEFRMGMHLGDVLVDNEDASGDGIDIAERLQEIAEPGGICLSRAAHAAVHKDFDTLFADGGSKALKDFGAPVHIYKLAPEAAMLAHVPAMTMPRQLLSLVVLPFVNASGTTRHDFVADSITDQLTGELARIEDSFVIDRKTALATVASREDVVGLGRRLGIRYAINGSVCASEGGLRIDTTLIDAETGDAVWNDQLDIAIGDPFVMQHEVSARLVPLVYLRLVAATGHKSALVPGLGTAQPFELAPASRPLSIAPVVVRETVPTAEPDADGVAEGQIPSVASTPAETDRPTALSLIAQAEDPGQSTAAAKSQAATLIARWQVLRRPLLRQPVNLPLASAIPLPPLRITASESAPVPAAVIQPAPELVEETAAPAPLAIALPVTEAPLTVPAPELPRPILPITEVPLEITEPELVAPLALAIQPEAEVAVPEPPPVSLLMIEPALENAAREPATVIIRPRTVAAAEPAGRVVSFRPISAPQLAPRIARGEIIEMRTPPQTDRPEWRMPLWLQLPLVTVVGVLGGAAALAKLGFSRETVVAIGSWILISTGLAQLTTVSVETVRSMRLLRPAPAGPAWIEPQPVRRPKRARAKVISIKAVLRSPRGTSRNRQYAP